MLAAPASLACKGNALCARKQRQGSRDNRHSLRDGLRLIRALLGVPGFLATVAAQARHPRSLIPASGDQDHAISLVRGDVLVGELTPAETSSRPPLPASNVRDDRDTPLLWR